MFEFDSVSVSAFEASSLASTLTERSADGWDVVAIVAAGSDVVAYLKKPVAASTPEIPAEPVTVSDLLTSSETTTPDPEPAAAGASSDTGGNGWAAADTVSTAASGGWGSTDATSSDTPSAAASTGWGSSATADPSTSAEPASAWSGTSQQAAATQAATPQVPAGWYADPAGRFELRYWDGGAWTEHVSRHGQQFTDPPIR